MRQSIDTLTRLDRVRALSGRSYPDRMSLKARIERRIWMRILGHPVVLLPLVLGLVAAAMFFTVRAPVLQQAVGALGFAAVAASWRYVRYGAIYGAEAEDELRRALHDARAEGLDRLEDLRHALQLGDHAPGTRDLDRLERLSDRLERGLAGDGFAVPAALAPTLTNLRDACFGLLRKAVRLGGVADDLDTVEAKAQVRELTAGVLHDAGEAINQLGRTLDRLQLRAVRDEASADEVTTIRGELDAQLAVARAVEDRLADLERSLGGDARDAVRSVPH